MLFNFSVVFAFFIIVFVFVFGVLIFAAFIRPKKPNPDKNTIYECGEPTIGSSWIRYNIRFYTIALVYLIFDVELIFLFPIAIHVKKLGMIAFIEMGVFVVVLAVGLVYAWKNGNLDWIRPRGDMSENPSPEQDAIQSIPTGTSVEAK